MKHTRFTKRAVVAAVVAMAGFAQGVPPYQGAPQVAPPPYQSGPQYPGGPQGPGAPPLQSGELAQHGVARISVMQGEVSVRHGDAGDLSAGALNAPLLTSDRVATGANSRAEVQFDAANMIRLAPSSEVRLGDVQYKRYLVQIAQGTTSFRVLRPNDSQVEISTPSVSVRPLGQATVRVTVNPDGTSEVTVRGGEVEVFSPKGTERLRVGQTMLARGDPADPEFQINAAIPNDAFDSWNVQRDGELNRGAANRRYVSPDVYGTEDLDANGRWVQDPQYGQVWVPNVDPDWAPYRVGRWVWEDYYGWVWVSGDPWGWAPYHWGRWYVGPYGWAWWPGGYGPGLYWSPALVGFFGWGGGFGVGVGFGFGFGFANVGWVPLAPYEAFHPWYGRGAGAVNIVNNFNVVNTFRNARMVNGANGITSMRSNEFGRGAVSAANFPRATGADLRSAGSIQGRMPVTPGAQSMRMSDRAVNTAGMPATNTSQRFAGRSSFGPAGGSTVSNGGWSRMSPGGSTPGGSGAGRAPGATSNPGGWQAFSPRAGGTTPSSGAAPRTAAPEAGYRGGTPAGNSGYSGGQARGAAPQQPVRISPPIVSNRGGSDGGNTPAAHPDVHSGFGGAHSGGGTRGGGGGHRGR